MKMVKSLLLGSAAGLVAVSAGQAADLPVKAKPVEYVKVCSLYGAGFYYMPGTDICLKIGGYVRAEATWGAGGNMQGGPIQGDLNNRLVSNLVMRARAYITADAREQTAFGTARAYVAVGLSSTDIANTLLPSFQGFNRAFIQWAGITAGMTQSFYDFYSNPAMAYRGYMPSSDTGDPGWWVWGYTAQLGNGLTATLSAEQARRTQICDFFGTAAAATLAANSGGSGAGACNVAADLATAQTANNAPLGYGGLQAPDIVGNIRIDQTWGSAQVMAAAHEVFAPYYQGTIGPNSGHPGDEWGWAVGGGLRLNFPMIAQGDYFQSQVNYTVGAPRYTAFTDSAPTLLNGNGNTLAYGLMSDCIYGASAASLTTPVITNKTGCNLTTAWGFSAGYEHYWTPQFHESFYGGWLEVRYNAQANDILCSAEGNGNGTAAALGGFGASALANAGCNNNWQIASAGTRFQYDVTKSLYLGVEFLYQRYYSGTYPNAGGIAAFTGQTANGLGGNGTIPVVSIKDQQNLAVTARIHKDFLP